MIRICCICNIKYGEKPPLEIKEITHGMCKPCYDKLIKDMDKKQKAKTKNKKQDNH